MYTIGRAKRARDFLHEHPWSATSWKVDEIQRLLSTKEVEDARDDSCQYGMRIKERNDQKRPVRGIADLLIEELFARGEATCGQHESLTCGCAVFPGSAPSRVTRRTNYGLQKQWGRTHGRLAPEIVATTRTEEGDCV